MAAALSRITSLRKYVQKLEKLSSGCTGKVATALVKPNFVQHCEMSIKIEGRERSQFIERGYILLAIPIITFGLGTWQVQRRKWKLGLIALMEEKTRAAPVPFPEDYVNELKHLEYGRVIVHGAYDHTREILVGPRSLVKSEESKRGGLMTQSGNSGYHVVTPFNLSDRNITILVNRGWVPADKKDVMLRLQGQIEGQQTLVGVVRNTEHRPQFSPRNDPNRNLWYYRDLEMMGDYLGTEPVMIDADKSGDVPGGPVGGQTRVSLRNEHASYIFTWYSLCLATSWIWYNRFGRKFMFK